MHKYKLFTHTDLDGVGCAIVAYHMLKNVEVEYCDYANINDKVKEFIESGKHSEFNAIFITDISVNNEVADLIDNINNLDENWYLFDHHTTALWLNKYDWSHVYEYDDISENSKSSGTSLFAGFLRFLRSTDNPLINFVEKVRRYDTWEWYEKYNDKKAKKLNDLLYILGRERFVERFKKDLSLKFNQTEELLLELEQEKIDEIAKVKQKQLIKRKLSGYNVGIVFLDTYQSEVGNRLASDNKDLNLIAMINPAKSVSFRTIKDDINLGEFARKLGGGGHSKAAGAPVKNNTVIEFISKLFKEGEVE